jgi:hypothetical protein
MNLVLCFPTYLPTYVICRYVGFKTYQPTYLWVCTTYLITKIDIYIYLFIPKYN